MKRRRKAMGVVLFAVMVFVSAPAEVVDGIHWADEVTGYTQSIQNYGGVLMTPATEWWVTGPPDADVDDNGYAWDWDDQDTVAGWRTTDAGEYVIVHWWAGVPDRPGDDLQIHVYGGPYALAEVAASVDGVHYAVVGTIGGGTPGYFRVETLDLGGLFDSCVRYVRVLRLNSGPQTGMFFDAFGGVPGCGDHDGDCDVDLHDLGEFQVCYGAGGPGLGSSPCAPGDCNQDDRIDGSDWQTLAGAITGPGSE